MSISHQQELSSASSRFLLWGLLTSLGLHLLFLLLMSPREIESLPLQSVIDVSFVTSPSSDSSKVPAQIVTQPEASEKNLDSEKPVKLLAEKESRTEKEQIKRGDDPNAGNSISKQPSKALPPSQKVPPQKAHQQPAQQSKEQVKTNEARHLTTLRLDSGTLIDKFAVQPKNQANKSTEISDTAGYTAFSRPPGSGAAFIGMRGSSDFLPNLPDGDITLLNTKADQFAVFVRRVATQVFSQLRRSGWEVLLASDIRGISDFCTVHVVLDRKGNLVKAMIESPSGSRRFDEILLSAARSGASDPNPPQAALAEDGNFHFIFKSRSWTQLGANARNGAPFERRWLLLATGLL